MAITGVTCLFGDWDPLAGSLIAVLTPKVLVSSGVLTYRYGGWPMPPQ
jgi:hypothetical protein